MRLYSFSAKRENIEFLYHVLINYPFKQYATGVNIIGMLPGTLAGSPNDRPFLIGSHYDTVQTTMAQAWPPCYRLQKILPQVGELSFVLFFEN